MKTQLATFAALAAQFQSVDIKTLLWLRKSKTNTQGTAPVMLRIFASTSERFERSTGIRITPEEWDAANGRILGKSKTAQKQNEQLQLMKAHIPELINLMKAVGKKVTLASLRRELAAPATAQAPCFIALCQQASESRDKQNPGARSNATAALRALTSWHGIDRRTKEPNRLPLDEFTPRLAAEFYHWLVQDKKLKISSANVTIGCLVGLFRYAAELGEAEIGDNPFRALRRKKAAAAATRLHLSIEQLAALREAPLTGKAALARDIYLTQYYLHGSRLGAVLMLRWESVADGCLTFQVEKGGPVKVVAISPELARLLARYRSAEATPAQLIFPCLPAAFFSLTADEQHTARHKATEAVNYQLGRIGANLSFPGKLHSHTARHTLARHAAELGGLDVAQGMLGHTTAAMTAHYTGELPNEGLKQVEQLLYGAEALPPTPGNPGRIVPMWKGGVAA
jgi:integrase/recombinase XerD